MIAECLLIKKLNPIVAELFIRGRKLKISLVFITQSYFAVPQNIRQDSTHYFITKIPNTQELQQIPFNHSSYIDIREFINVLQNHIFLGINVAFVPDKPLYFRRNLLEYKNNIRK